MSNKKTIDFSAIPDECTFDIKKHKNEKDSASCRITHIKSCEDIIDVVGFGDTPQQALDDAVARYERGYQ